MSSDTDDAGDEDPAVPVNISLSLGESGELWVARDEDTGVTSQGRTRQTALENLDTAVEGYHGAGDEPSEDDLRALGIDPERNTSGSPLFNSRTPLTIFSEVIEANSDCP